MARSSVELMGLEVEAERLVRLGESRAEVARMLGVHPTTLSGWALRGGWRKKDLDFDRSLGTTKRTIRNIAAANAHRDEARRMMAAQAAAFAVAIRLIAEKGGAAGAEIAALLEGLSEAPRLAAPEPEPMDPRVVGWKSMGEVKVADDAKIYDENGEEWTRD
jgi:hypothetical protein